MFSHVGVMGGGGAFINCGGKFKCSFLCTPLLTVVESGPTLIGTVSFTGIYVSSTHCVDVNALGYESTLPSPPHPSVRCKLRLKCSYGHLLD